MKCEITINYVIFKKRLLLLLYLFHCDSSLDFGFNSIHLASHSEKIEGFVFLSDCILSIDLGTFDISLLKSFLDLSLLSRLFFLSFFTKPFQLLGTETKLKQSVYIDKDKQPNIS